MTEFKLPSSSYNELTKLIKAYSSHPKGASLDDISQSTAIHRVVVSKNSKFFMGVGIIEGGNKKSPTSTGLNLGRALSFNKPEDIIKYWKEVISSTDFFKKMLTVLEVKGGMTEADFISHIEYSSGQKKTKESRAGSGAIVEILKAANLIKESDGKLTSTNNLDEIEQTKDELIETIIDEVHQENSTQNNEGLSSNLTKKVTTNQTNETGVTINLNIQLTVPETTDEKVYDKFFESMKRHLLS